MNVVDQIMTKEFQDLLEASPNDFNKRVSDQLEMTLECGGTLQMKETVQQANLKLTLFLMRLLYFCCASTELERNRPYAQLSLVTSCQNNRPAAFPSTTRKL